MNDESRHMRILGVFAHPDDAEFFCGATFARWAAEGAEIVWLLATSGDKGSADPQMTAERLVATREAETRSAAQRLGVHEVIFLRYPDGELSPTLDLRRDIVRVIRLKRPDLVVTSDPTVFWFGDRAVNHPDHRAIGEATLAAVYPTARDHLNFAELSAVEGLEPHKTRQLWITLTSSPNVKMDVTDFVEARITALREHKSQIADMEAMAARQYERLLDPDAPPGTRRYVETFRVISFDR